MYELLAIILRSKGTHRTTKTVPTDIPLSVADNINATGVLNDTDFVAINDRVSFFIVRQRLTSPFADIPAPTFSYPYSRLAATTLNNSANFFLYRQINGSTLAQDFFDTGPQVWSSINIPIWTE